MIAAFLSRLPWGWIALVAAVCLILLLAYCAGGQGGRDDVREAAAGETLAGARTDAAQDASQIRDGNDAANTETRTQVQEAQDEVRRSPDPADRDRLARQRLCQLNPGACAR